ncbi:MAG TPA: 3'-5' exonuclease, partial [archaeon]|nr:3'-5' exonuclease [archaeon]
AFVDVVRDYDPDVLTGFNINNFDVPYLLERMRKAGVSAHFGRCLQKQVNSTRVGIRSRTSIVGRVALDSYEIVKKDFSLQRYGLDFVARKLLGEEKGDVRKSEIEKLWRGGAADFERLVRYSEQDSLLALKLVQQLHLLDKYLALARVSGVLLQDALGGGETTRIEHFLLR